MSEDEGPDEISLEIENQGDIDYNPEFEQLLKENGDHAQVYSILHQMSHVKYRSLYDKCNIPLIIITAVIGFVTGIGMPYQYTNTALGAASVFVSIMKSIVSYLKLSERSENHRICSLQFAQISNEIKMELSLRRSQRQPAKMMLDIVKVKYKNLMEVAQLLDNDVIRRFREKYLSHKKDSEISLPPVFSNIPGIRILGADSEHEYMEQMEKNLQRYTAEKQFERDHMESEFKHVVALRAIREKYRISDRGKEEQDLRASRYAPSPSRPRRQNSMGEEPRASSLSSSALPSSALSSSALSTIPEQEPSENPVSLAPTSPV
jgi:hypothetical protein